MLPVIFMNHHSKAGDSTERLIAESVTASAWRKHLANSECSPTGELDMLYALDMVRFLLVIESMPGGNGTSYHYM